MSISTLARAEKAESEIEHLKSLNAGAHDVIARLWAIFGTPTYEELGGKSIYDLVQDAVDRAEKAEEALRKSEWQPIETAPKNRHILTYRIAVTEWTESGWCCTDGHYLANITHWREPPDPPFAVWGWK